MPGLFCAGADAGGLQDNRYVGGLALGAVFGPRAAEAAIRSIQTKTEPAVPPPFRGEISKPNPHAPGAKGQG